MLRGFAECRDPGFDSTWVRDRVVLLVDEVKQRRATEPMAVAAFMARVRAIETATGQRPTALPVSAVEWRLLEAEASMRATTEISSMGKRRHISIEGVEVRHPLSFHWRIEQDLPPI